MEEREKNESVTVQQGSTASRMLSGCSWTQDAARTAGCAAFKKRSQVGAPIIECPLQLQCSCQLRTKAT